jgi:hypothetical protein
LDHADLVVEPLDEAERDLVLQPAVEINPESDRLLGNQRAAFSSLGVPHLR